ncbi:MAG: aminomethyl transferase family protein, partial [Rhodobacteraceae bacterium]|nr:aminomethyl transferase family protein [Paracoccaceae bacterium]
MHPDLKKLRFSVKPFPVEGNRPVELARTMAVHPLTYQELPFEPEYSLYAGRLTPEKMTNATPDEMYWAARQGIILRHTGEHPFEIAGPDALKLLQRIFPRDVAKVKTGRCSYQFACYHDGGMITDGLLLRVAEDRFWFAQADGDLFSWYMAHAAGLDVTISDPEVWLAAR